MNVFAARSQIEEVVRSGSTRTRWLLEEATICVRHSLLGFTLCDSGSTRVRLGYNGEEPLGLFGINSGSTRGPLALPGVHRLREEAVRRCPLAPNACMRRR